MPSDNPDLDRAARLLAGARSVCLLTGAGISAESGIPTFREAQTGLWARFDPMDLASIDGFRRQPEVVWEWYRWRIDRVRNAAPNPAHQAVAALQRLCPQFTLITQNVDDLHQRGGAHSVIHLHGSLLRTCCSSCPTTLDGTPDSGGIPRCPTCGDLLRPAVVWFGEPLPEEAWRQAAVAAAGCEVMLVVGTSGLVYPAAHLPEIARQSGASLIEINRVPSELMARLAVEVVLAGPAGTLLPQLAARLTQPAR